MGIVDRLVDLRYPIAVVAASAVALFSLLRLGPSFFPALVGFFGPLFLSTGCFLAAVAVLLWISPPQGGREDDMAGEELMDYVAGQPMEPASAAGVEEEEEHIEKEAENRKEE